jgi:hypothetical protein
MRLAAVLLAACGARTALLDDGEPGLLPTADAGASEGSCDACPGPSTVVLFGGYAGFGEVLGDTWTWDGNTWTELPVSGPLPRSSPAMTTLNGVSVLFGADNALPTLPADTWGWDGSQWSIVSPASSPSHPTLRDDTAMATLDGKAILFGGLESLGSAGTSVLGDTWQWDGAAWTQLQVAGPSARYGHTMTTAGGKIVLFGGNADGNVIFGDTWEWDGQAWTQVSMMGPSARAFHAAAALGDDVVVFGGCPATGDPDTWRWDGRAWTRLQIPGPGARCDHAMASIGGKIVLFGGTTDLAVLPLYDTWEFDGGSWTQHTPATHPSGRASPGIASRE